MPFDPNQVKIDQVGNATFQPTAADTGVLTYNVSAEQIVKNIQRITLVPMALAGDFVGGATVNDTSCLNPADDGPTNIPANVHVTQSQTGQIQIVLDIESLATCTLTSTGPVTQTGQLFAFPASLDCTATAGIVSPFNGAVTVSELRATSLGIEGRWTSPDVGGCHEEARFGGVLQY